MHRFGYRGAALAHDTPIAPDAPNSILPPLAVLATALALVDELAELGAAAIVLHLERR